MKLELLFLIRLDLIVILEMFPQLSWSYSKYMAALKKEEVLLKKQMEASFSTASGTVSEREEARQTLSPRLHLFPTLPLSV